MKKTILLVDDEIDILDIQHRYLIPVSYTHLSFWNSLVYSSKIRIPNDAIYSSRDYAPTFFLRNYSIVIHGRMGSNCGEIFAINLFW